MGLNDKSHLGICTPPSPEVPILIPKASKDTHYEGEVAAVIGTSANAVGTTAPTKTCRGGAPRAPIPSKFTPGDVEGEIKGIGILRNRVAAA